MKNTFVVRKVEADMILNLPDEMAGQFIKTIIKYAMYADSTEADNPAIKAMFEAIKPKLDEDAAKYEERCRINKENRAKRKSTNGNESLRLVTNGDEPSLGDSLSLSLSDTLSDKDEEETIVTGYFNDPELDKSFSDYVAQRQKMNAPVDFQRTQKTLYDMAKGDKKTMIAILEQSLSQGYKGLYELKQPRAKPTSKGHFENERQYDFDEIERTLLGGAR